MPPQRTQIACPRCRQPVTTIVEQLFDVTSDPGAKQRLLGGVSNHAVCQNCGFNGPLSTPVVYHDADKELLLTYFPTELGMPVNEQEKLVGPLITQITNKLPPEKRKAYLLRPQSFLTYQSFIERILGADGITPEMIQAQQKRITIIERLLTVTSNDARSVILKEEAAAIDAEFFGIFGRLMENALASNQETITKQMDAIQQQLLAETEYGRRIASQYKETQEAVKTLQAAGKSLDREKLLNILMEAPNEDRVNALVSYTRPALDYQFFQMLSEAIDKKSGDEKKRLETLRERLLDLTRKIDQRVEEEFKHATTLLETLIGASDIQKATAEHLPEMGEMFIQVLNQALQDANRKNDTVRMPKLQQIAAILQKASAPPPELELLETLLEAPDETALNKLIEENADKLTPEFSAVVASVINRSETEGADPASDEEKKVLEKLQTVYKSVLKFSMKKSLN